MDTGEIQTHQALDIFVLDESFRHVPSQAISLHLTGIVPADSEDDWDPFVHERIKRELDKHTESEEHKLIYEANILFGLRNTIIVDIMRLVNLSGGVVCCTIKRYLSSKRYGVISADARKRVIEMAKRSGENNFLIQ